MYPTVTEPSESPEETLFGHRHCEIRCREKEKFVATPRRHSPVAVTFGNSLNIKILIKLNAHLGPTQLKYTFCICYAHKLIPWPYALPREDQQISVFVGFALGCWLQFRFKLKFLSLFLRVFFYYFCVGCAILNWAVEIS